IRASLITNTVQEPLQDLLRLGEQSRVRQVLTRITEDERVYGVAYCASPTARPITAGTLPAIVQCGTLESLTDPEGHVVTSPQGPLLISVHALGGEADAAGRLVLVHDMSFVARRS